MRRVLTVMLVGALWAVADARAMTENEASDPRGPVRAVRVEVAEFTPKGAGGRVPVREETYDARGNRVRRVEFGQDGSAALTLVYSYDEAVRENGYEEFAFNLSRPRRHVYVLGARGERVEYRIVQPDGAAGERCV